MPEEHFTNYPHAVARDAGLREDMRPVLVMLPFLGGSTHEWAEVMSGLSPGLRCSGIDLPGFGGAAEVPGYSVDEMVDYVSGRLKALRLHRFVLVGHSMAGKVAMGVARRALDDAELSGLQGLVLVCSSPPSAEPMDEQKRAQMKADLGKSGAGYRQHAEAFIRENAAEELTPHIFERAVGDVLRMNMAAWNAWLDLGSKEDWSDRIGVLDLPTLVIAGEKDKALGAATQESLVMPHFCSARLEVVADAAHLIPMERPHEIAELLLDFANGLTKAGPTEVGRDAPIEASYLALIESDRVSEQTRRVLLQRSVRPEEREEDHVLSAGERKALQAIAESVAPMEGRSIEFALRIDARLASGKGKGWRYAILPPDLATYRAALNGLDRYARATFRLPFAELGTPARAKILRLVEAGEFEASERSPGETGSELAPVQMQRWFEELRGEVAGIYMADPGTLAQIGYSGIADGSNSSALSGFVELGLGKVEPWEPKPDGAGE